MDIPQDINSISKNNIKIIEYYNSEIDEVEKVFVQNGILGFFATEQEMRDLSCLLNYYLNIEEISQIK